jgi:hypothetical protein
MMNTHPTTHARAPSVTYYFHARSATGERKRNRQTLSRSIEPVDTARGNERRNSRRGKINHLHRVFRALHGSQAPLRRVIPLRMPCMIAVSLAPQSVSIICVNHRSVRRRRNRKESMTGRAIKGGCQCPPMVVFATRAGGSRSLSHRPYTARVLVAKARFDL